VKLRETGFTLIEVVIGAALMSLILVSAYLCLSAGFSSQKMIEPRTEIIQNARVAMALITADLRGACSLSRDMDFLGMPRTLGKVQADNLDFGTHNYTPRHPRESDFCQESIYVNEDPKTHQFSIWRRRNPTMARDPLSGGNKEEIADGIVGLKFEYFDGEDWYDTWGEIKSGKRETTQRDQPNLSGLPAAVRITLLMDSNPKSKKMTDDGEREVEPPLAFQTVVELNLKNTTTTSSGSAATQSDATTDSSQNGGQPQ
jgi:prepilin-type N-terminal cleavage/methylation domain-containing protein